MAIVVRKVYLCMVKDLSSTEEGHAIKHTYHAPLTWLSSYQIIPVLIRLSAVSLIALLIIGFMVFISKDGPQPIVPTKIDYVVVVAAFIFLIETQVKIDNVLEQYISVLNKPILRILIQFIFNIALILVVYFLTDWVVPLIDPASQALEGTTFYAAIAVGLIFLTLFANSLSLARSTEKWANAQRKINALEREKMKMDYAMLQDQLNPHFLFNNMSVLKSLIIYDKKAAVAFTENFTDVYRYVLRSKENELIALSEELEFIKAYIGLHQERHGHGLQAQFKIDPEANNQKIAPMTLQLLVENAIKHNIASEELPLNITIEAKAGWLTVANNLQKKTTTYSTKTGLGNLRKRYVLLTGQAIAIDDTENQFKVTVPLINE